MSALREVRNVVATCLWLGVYGVESLGVYGVKTSDANRQP
jgi:hypothetical protein